MMLFLLILPAADQFNVIGCELESDHSDDRIHSPPSHHTVQHVYRRLPYDKEQARNSTHA